MFFWWSSTKIVQAVWIRQKTWPPGGRAYFPYICIYIENLKKSSCQKPLDRFQYNLEGMCLWSPSSKVVQGIMIRQKYGCKGVGLIFPIYLYRKLEKKSSCQKPLDQFQYNLAEMFPWWPFTKIVQAVMICQKTWLLGGGAYFPCISI